MQYTWAFLSSRVARMREGLHLQYDGSCGLDKVRSKPTGNPKLIVWHESEQGVK